jgi:hypothetical protein
LYCLLSFSFGHCKPKEKNRRQKTKKRPKEKDRRKYNNKKKEDKTMTE